MIKLINLKTGLVVSIKGIEIQGIHKILVAKEKIALNNYYDINKQIYGEYLSRKLFMNY